MKPAEAFTPTAYIVLCTQKRLFLVKKRLLHQILTFNENTCTWFDILAVQKCQPLCFQFGSARLAMWKSFARPGSARSGQVRFGSARPAVWMSPKGQCSGSSGATGSGTSEIEGLARWNTPIVTSSSPSRAAVCGATNTLAKWPLALALGGGNVKQPLRIRNLMWL